MKELSTIMSWLGLINSSIMSFYGLGMAAYHFDDTSEFFSWLGFGAAFYCMSRLCVQDLGLDKE